MNYYGIAGSALLACSGVLSAAELNRRATERQRQVEAWIEFLRYVGGQVKYFSMPMAEILAHCDRALLCACGYSGKAPPSSFEEMLSASSLRDRETRAAIEGFAREFGRSYREEQVARCEGQIEALCRHRDVLAAGLSDIKKRNAALCISGALALALLLW